MTLLGNTSLLELPKHGFLCSRTTSSSAILPCLDWAVAMAKGSEPIMSTFHSQLEQSVLELLASGSCPIIMVLGRKQYHKLPQKLQPLLAQNRLLLVSVADQPRIDRHSATLCNQYIATHSETLTFGYISPNSPLADLYQNFITSAELLTYPK